MELQRKQLIELRRHKNTLAVVGLGVILFGFWSLIKVMVIDYINPLSEYMTEIEEADRGTFMIVYYTIIALVVGFDFILRLIVGSAAIRAGTSTGKKRLSIVGFWLIVIYDVIELVLDFIGITGTLDNLRELSDLVAECIVDATSLFILILLLRAAVRYRELQEELVLEPRGPNA